MLEVVILAAGQGTRMKSKLPKVLHPVCGRSMLGYSVLRAQEMGAQKIVVVTGHGADKVEQAFADSGVVFARQDQQLGTAHAFKMAVPHLSGTSDVLVLYGDTPLIRLDTLQNMQKSHAESGAGMTVLTAELPDATGYGRIVRGADGSVERIVEEKAASPEEKKIREFNSGVYLFNPRALELVNQIGNSNPANEYYLTDILELYRQEGAKVEGFKIQDASELSGSNDRVQLAEADLIMRRRINEQHMRAGVTLVDPESTYIEDTVKIGRDALIEPGAVLKGSTVLGEDVRVGAYSVIESSLVQDGVTIKSHTVLEGAEVHSGADAGPFARLRPGAVLEKDVHVGNFVEVKNARMLQGAKAGHLSYLGDATVGREVNVGAGTITANYNGIGKFNTVIGDGAFIGSNSVLVAPVEIGAGAMIAAGSVVTQDVPEGSLGVARGRQRNIDDYARRFWEQHSEKVSQKHAVLHAWLQDQKVRNS